jgi:hypothetical protein
LTEGGVEKVHVAGYGAAPEIFKKNISIPNIAYMTGVAYAGVTPL